MTRQLLLFKLIINYISLDFSSQQISSQIPLSKRYLTFKFQVLYVLISCLHHMLENSNLATSILSLLPDFKKFCFQICSLFCANPALQRALCVRSQFGSFKQSHYELAFNRIYYYRKQGGNPRQPKQTSSAGQNPQGGWIFQQAELGAVLGAAGAIANTSALPSAPAEAADVPQTLSRMKRLIPLLIQINTPAHPLCPLPEDFRLDVPQSLFVFLF